MKEEKCINCGDLYENGYNENNTDLCDDCVEKALIEFNIEPDMTGASKGDR